MCIKGKIYSDRSVLMMKKIVALLFSMLLCLSLCACNKEGSSAENNSFVLKQPDGLPVLSITTIDQSENALDFVTKPVTGFVADQIASWTPNYQMPLRPFYKDCKVTITDTTVVVVPIHVG